MSTDIFEGPYFEPKEREIFGYLDCPPMGKTRINIGTTAISVDIEFGEPDSKGNSNATAYANLDPDVAQATLNALQPLWVCWGSLWPKIHQSLLEIREEYGREAAVTAQNLKMTIFPPGDYVDYEAEEWSCEMELEPCDGYFGVEFELDGTISDSWATF